MWPDRRLCSLFEIEHPVIQAPMVGSCTPELAGAVANAGGLGSLGCGMKSTDTIRQEVTSLKRCTNRAFNLNFFVHKAPQTDADTFDAARDRLKPWYDRYGLGEPPAELPKSGPGFGETELAVLLDLKPRVVSFHFGAPEPDHIAAIKEAGILMISSATTVAEAVYLESAGMDAIIAQGWEAGGHRGSHVPGGPADGVGSMALIPQVADAVSVPVIAAGGIGDARAIVAALALGASGVQMGTAFLRCTEAATDLPRLNRLAKAKDTDTTVTRAVSGRAARGMRSEYAEEMERNQQALPAFPQMYGLSNPVRNAASDDEASFLLYGQAAPLAKEMQAGDLMAQLVSETGAILKGFADR